MNRQNIVKSISTWFTTERHNATKFGVNQVLMAITLVSNSGIIRICKIAAFSGDGLVRTSRWHENRKEENMESNPRVYGRGTFY